MPGCRAYRRFAPHARLIDSALLVGIFLSMVSSPNTASAAGRAPVLAEAPSNLAPTGGDLAVDPPSFWMRSGENVSLQAVWSTNSPLCPATPLWYRWSVLEGAATGFLNATTGPQTSFTAKSFESGSIEVEVRSEAVFDCEGNRTANNESSVAKLTVAAPLALVNVTATPYAPSENDTLSLSGAVVGGVPPYELDVDWGDGVHTRIEQDRPGPFAANHTFASGEFVPSVLAEDSVGDFENRSVQEAFSVATGFRVDIVPQQLAAEVGSTVEFTGLTADAPPGAVTLIDCTNATVVPLSNTSTPANLTPFACTFHVPGVAVVFVGVYSPSPGGPSASAILYETIVQPLHVEVQPVDPRGEVGGSALIEVSLSGGILPVTLAWNLTGNRSTGSERVWSDGEGVVSVELSTAGEYALGMRAIDALGSVGENTTPPLQVEAALQLRTESARSIGPQGILAQIGGTVLSGCAPFDWWVVPSISASNETATNGSLPTAGDFGWSGRYLEEATLSLTTGVVDACGAGSQTALGIELVPPFVATAATSPHGSGDNRTIVVELSVGGGWPPYHFEANGSDGESWNRSIPAAGACVVDLPTVANATLSVEVTLSDSLGSSRGFYQSIVFPPQNSSPPPPPRRSLGPVSVNEPADPSPIAALGLFASLAVPVGVACYLGVRWRGRLRRRKRDLSGPDPVTVLRQIIEPAEGAERFTVELLAEEAGVPLGVVRSTIERLVQQGTVRAESGADGEEVLSWVRPGGR